MPSYEETATQYQQWPVQLQPSPPSPSSNASVMSEELSVRVTQQSEASTSDAGGHLDGCIRHKVSKLDTLAGIAIRYNVSVSDIKRLNGLLSDTAMFARECVLVPTKQLPVGDDAHVLFARLMSGYGRDISLNASERNKPGSMAVAQMPGSPMASKSSRCGSEEDDTGTPYSRRSDRSSEPGDVELIERSGAEYIPFGAAGSYGNDKVRRRKQGSDSGPATMEQPGASGFGSEAMTWLTAGVGASLQQLQQQPLLNGHGRSSLSSSNVGSRSISGSGGSGGANAWQPLSQLGQVISQSALVQKIKRAASQPALATAQQTSLTDVGDAVMKGVTQPGGSSTAADGMSRALPSTARKDSKRD